MIGSGRGGFFIATGEEAEADGRPPQRTDERAQPVVEVERAECADAAGERTVVGLGFCAVAGRVEPSGSVETRAVEIRAVEVCVAQTRARERETCTHHGRDGRRRGRVGRRPVGRIGHSAHALNVGGCGQE